MPITELTPLLDILKLKANHGLTGDFYLDRDGRNDGALIEDGEIAFLFGPEENPGGNGLSMSDHYSAYDWMRTVLDHHEENIGYSLNVDIGAAENYHIVELPANREDPVHTANRIFNELKQLFTVAAQERGVTVTDWSDVDTYRLA